MKSVYIRSYSRPHFPAFGLHTDQNDSEHRNFLRSDNQDKSLIIMKKSIKTYVFAGMFSY